MSGNPVKSKRGKTPQCDCFFWKGKFRQQPVRHPIRSFYGRMIRHEAVGSGFGVEWEVIAGEPIGQSAGLLQWSAED